MGKRKDAERPPAYAEIEELTGIEFPPKNRRDIETTLFAAGFSQDQVDRYLNHCGYPGFEDSGEFPTGQAAVAASSSENGQPLEGPGVLTDSIDGMLFTERVLVGLRSRLHPQGGPCDDGFRWQGKVSHGLGNGKPRQLIDFLWGREGHPATFEDLAKPIYGDHAVVVEYDQVRGLAARANSFFRENDIPLMVSVLKQHGTVFLKKI
jgi:hypothetical protein